MHPEGLGGARLVCVNRQAHIPYFILEIGLNVLFDSHERIKILISCANYYIVELFEHLCVCCFLLLRNWDPAVLHSKSSCLVFSVKYA